MKRELTIPSTWGATGEQSQGLLVSSRRILERNQTAPATAGAEAQGWPAPNPGPSGTHRNRVCASDRFGLEDVTKGTWLRQRRELLATAARLDEIGGLGRGASAPSERAWPPRRDRPESSDYRQTVGARCFWGVHTGPNPTDRGKNGCKRHLIVEAQGLPLVVRTTPANVNDAIPALALLDLIPWIKGPTGRCRYRPSTFQGDAAYGTPTNLQGAKTRGITALKARPGQRKAGQQHGSGLGRFRYVIERTLAWFGYNRRLKICYERTGKHFQAFHDLAAGLICARRLASCRF
jgi:transposase